MISLAVKYLTFYGYLVISPEEQKEVDKRFTDGHGQFNPLEKAYQEGFHDAKQIGN